MTGFKVNDFLAFEEKYALFERTVNNWNIWEYIRFDVYVDMKSTNSKDLRIVRERKSKITVRKVWNVFLNCTIRHPLLVAKKRDILIFTNQIRNLNNGKYECRVTDDIISEFKESIQAAELISEIEKGHMEPTKTENMLRCDYLDVFPTLFSGLYLKKEYENLKIIERECERIHRLANLFFKFAFDLQKITYRARTVYIRWISRKNGFKKLFTEISPRILIEATSYSASRMIMNEAAHELNIKVIELQHGVISPGHIAYNYAVKRDLKTSPDYLFCYSDFWKRYANYIQPVDRIVSVGYPYFDRMKSKYPHQNSLTNELRILVISQHIFTDRLVEDINIMVNKLDKDNKKYHVIYKMHPRESTLSIRNNKLFDNRNIELIDNPGANLYECFSRSDIQVGISSSALYEGLGYGLSTYILHYDTSEAYMGEICAKNYAIMVEGGAELADALMVRKPGMQIDGSFFFKENALSNISSEIMKLLKV